MNFTARDGNRLRAVSFSLPAFGLLVVAFLFALPVYKCNANTHERREDDESDNDKHHDEQCTLNCVRSE